ncbi:MAG: hypothetical protein GDA45_06325 [Chromatiales bacterium]|nr:hypothetical protein [Chromatiales bacterium]
MSRAQIVLASAFIIFILSATTIFMVYQSDDPSYTYNETKVLLNPLADRQSDLEQSTGLAIDDTVGVSDFGRRLDATDERLTAIEQSAVLLQSELSNYNSTAVETSQGLAAEMRSLKNRMAELVATDNTLSNTVARIEASIQTINTEPQPPSANQLPVVGLKLLSVSIWDDGAVAIVSLGNRKTGLSVGNFFAGLKVENLSVAEQSLTLYEPATDKLYTLYADAIVYKEAPGQ